MLDLKAIGERVRKIRGKLSQYEFADKLQYGQPFVSEIERGKKGTIHRIPTGHEAGVQCQH